MGRRLILGTCILIDMERSRLQRSRFAALDDELSIAATAAQTERLLITRDSKAAFDDLPGVRVEFPK